MRNGVGIRGFYLYSVRFGEEHGGVERKIRNQVKSLNSFGLDCELIVSLYSDTPAKKIARRIPFFGDGRDWSFLQTAEGYDYVYIRRPAYVSGDLLDAIRAFRANNPRAKVLMEIPTFPYEGELGSLSQKPLLIKDRMNRRKLIGLVDRVVDNSGARDIFSIPALQIWNGIDLSLISPKEPVDEIEEINILCPAKFAPWHGVDRFIEGLARHDNTTRTIRLHLLGEGPSLGNLKQRVMNLGLSDYVLFYGMCSPEEMDRIYNICTLGLDSIGVHRRGPLAMSSSLKNAEYLAKGLPFIYSGNLSILQRESTDFCMEIPSDESPVDISAVIAFHDELYARYRDQRSLIDAIRLYAERNVDMSVAMESVVRYLRSELTRQHAGCA